MMATSGCLGSFGTIAASICEPLMWTFRVVDVLKLSVSFLFFRRFFLANQTMSKKGNVLMAKLQHLCCRTRAMYHCQSSTIYVVLLVIRQFKCISCQIMHCKVIFFPMTIYARDGACPLLLYVKYTYNASIKTTLCILSWHCWARSCALCTSSII